MRVDAKNILLSPKSGENIMMLYNGTVPKQLGTRKDTVYLITSDDSLATKPLLVKATIVQNFDKLTPEQRLNAPVVSIDKKTANAGELYIGEVGTCSFELTNKGKSDLVIRRLMGSEPCITAKAASLSIKKGGKTRITVSLNSKDLHGQVEKSLTIITNDPANPYTVVKVAAKVVIPGIEPIGN
jgi:hypothetical protein